jgi:D-alanyl-D-alanine carboxypeptidase (penicillin-binding protein 5/6)
MKSCELVRRRHLSVIACLLSVSVVSAQPAAKTAADRPDGPPVVTAKAWAIADGRTGKVLWGDKADERRPIASTTKVMTAWIVLSLAADDPKVLDETVTVSERAAGTPGSSARIKARDKLPVRDLLYGLLLPSGNDAAVALAEHFGPHCKAAEKGDGLERFVAEMNRRAKDLGLKETSYTDPNGLSRECVSSARDLAALAHRAMQNDRFRGYVSTRKHTCTVTTPDGGRREAAWTNTNRLLDIEGYDGVKTGTTTPAGNCLVASGRRGGDHLIVVVLGCASSDGRYADARNLFRWAWRERTGATPGAR